MIDNGSDDRPLALGELAQADSPEIVRAALARFRKRILVRGLVVVLIVAAAALLYPRYFGSKGPIVQEIADARGVILGGNVQSDQVEATIFKMARLSDVPSQTPLRRYGFHLILRASFTKPGEQLVLGLRPEGGVIEVYSGTSSLSDASVLEVWISATAGTQTIDIPVAGVIRDGSGFSLAHASLGTLHLDMDELNVPDWIWR